MWTKVRIRTGSGEILRYLEESYQYRLFFNCYPSVHPCCYPCLCSFTKSSCLVVSCVTQLSAEMSRLVSLLTFPSNKLNLTNRTWILCPPGVMESDKETSLLFPLFSFTPGLRTSLCNPLFFQYNACTLPLPPHRP